MKKYLKYLLYFLIVGLIILFVGPKKVRNNKKDIYDVVLFWGQSNMVGCSGIFKSTNELYGEDKKDKRLDELGIREFSKRSKIEREILEKYTSMNHVDVSIEDNTVFDYNYDYDNKKDSFIEVNKDTKYIGKNINVKKDNNNIVFYNSLTDNPSRMEDGHYDDSGYTLQRSYGTNMTSYFGKVYNELTGHKLVIVLASNNGEEISHFLPHDRVLELSHEEEYFKNQYIYEAMIDKYKKAINYLEKNNLKIGERFYVVFQGEADAKLVRNNLTTKSDYYNTFMEVHNNLKKELDLSFGVLVETSRTIGTCALDSVNEIHEAQESLINNNNDIILGSSYAFDTFIPCRKESAYKDDKTLYNKAYYNSSLSVSITEASVDVNGNQINRIHFNSAALSQIGKESAINVIKYLNNHN